MLKIDLKSLNKPKIIYSILIILLVTSISCYLLKEKERKLRIHTQQQLTQEIEARKRVENKLVETQRAKEQLDSELYLEKEKSQTLKKELKDREQQIKAALDRIEQEIAARRKAEAQLMITLKEKDILEAKVKNLKKIPTIELEKIVIKPNSAITGKIIMVNKEYAFVVLNLGSLHNIKIGDILSVYRNDEFIGKVQVEKTDEKMSAAAILPAWQNAEFKENDVVKLL